MLTLSSGRVNVLACACDRRLASPEAQGLVHRIVADDLLSAAVAQASDLSAIPAQAYGHTKSQLRGPTLARIRAGADIDGEVRKIWGAPQTLQGIADYVERLRRR